MVKEKETPAHYKIAKIARDLEKAGYPVIHLELGDPEIEVNHDIAYELYRAAMMGYTHYGDPRGVEPLREKLSEHLNNKLKVNVTKENISVTIGSKSGVYMSFRALLRHDDKVLLISPVWGLYQVMLDDLGIKYYNLKTNMENKWTPTMEDLEKYKNCNIKAIVVNNPNNPTSVVWDKETVEMITDFARKIDAYIIADEVYIDYSRKPFYSFLQTDYEKVIAVYSFSKSYAMTGFRIGYTVASTELATEISRLLQLYITNVPEFIQLAALKALDLPWVVEENRRILWSRTDYLTKSLKELGFKFIEPEGAFYVFTKVPGGWSDGVSFCMDLLQKCYVSIAPGTGFGGYEDYIRFSATASLEKIKIAIERIKKLIEGS